MSIEACSKVINHYSKTEKGHALRRGTNPLKKISHSLGFKRSKVVFLPWKIF